MSRLLLIPAILALLLVVLFTGQPASAQFDRGVFLGLTQVGITVTASLYDGDEVICREDQTTCVAVPITNEAWQWQRSATKTGVYSDIPASEGGTSNPYTPSEGDLGMWLKAKVTYDVASYTGRNAAGTALQPVLSQPVVSNSGYYHYLFLTYGLSYDSVLETQRYAQGFTTGPDTSGYLLTAVRLSLDSDGNAAGTWAVHADDAGKPAAAPLAAASPILNTDVDSAIDTFEEFTHPGGVRLQPDTKYWIVISQTSGQDRSQTGGRNDYILVGGFGGWSYILPAQHSSDTPYVDPGSEDGWSIDEALGYHILEELESANPYPTLSPWTTLADAVKLSTEIVVRMALLVAPEVTAQFTQDSYTVDEGGTQTVTVELSADPERTVTIPITATGEGGATSTDFSIPAGVTFNRGETSKTFTFTATQDTVDDDDESVKLEFGTMPDAWVSAGTRDETTVSITDDDDPFVTVTYGRSSYTVAEGGTQSVTVTLSADPERTVEIPLTTTDRGGAGSADYSGVPSMVTFDSGETSRSFNFAATQDTVDDDDESVKLGFGTMPDARVSAGSTDEAIVSITDDDDPEVTIQYGQATQGVGEGETVNVSVSLSADPERTVTIPVTATGQDGATSADYSVPSSVTFNAGEVLKTIAFTAANDAADDDDESVKLGFGTGLPTRVTLGTRTETTLDIGDDDDPTVTVAFASATYTAAEGGTQTVTVNVSADPERTIIIPVTATLQGTASAADYSGVPPSVTFNDGDTSASFTFTATQDLIDDDDEGLKLGFGAMPDPRVSAGTTDETTLSITDDDTADIVLSPASLTVAEQAFSGAGYTVALATEPTVDVTVTISGQEDTDLTLSGPDLNTDELTFTAANWDTPQAVTIMADHDDDTDDDTDDDIGTLTHTGGGGEYEGLDNGLTVRTNDNTGDLRLVDGTLTDANGNLCEGRLEIYYDGAWGTICDDYWNGQEADVACRALGFVASVEDADRYRTAYFGPGSEDQEIVLDDLNCRGDESGLLECPSNHPTPRVHNCKHKEDVGLRCLKPGQSPPWIIDIEFGEPPGGNGSYDGGETLEVTLVWSEPVTVSTPSGGLPPKVWVAYGTHLGKAEYASGSGTDHTVFSHTLKTGSHSLVRVTYNTLQERDGSIVGAASGQGAVLGHSSYSSGQAQSGNQAEAATIIGAPVFNDPGPDNAWRAGESVEVTLIFSQPVRVDATGGAPSLPVLLSGTAERQALYRRGSGSRQLVFGYTLTADDGAHSSLLVEPNSLALNGGAIRDAANNLGAAIGHEGGGAIFARQAQDETAPQLESATVDGSSLTLAFDEDLDNGNTLPSSLFGVNVNEASRSVMGVAVGQASVTLLLASAVAAGDTVTVDYTVPTEESATKLQDRSGNAVESFSGQAATNNTRPPANRAATGAPAITGTARVGETLTVDATGISDEDGLENAAFSYQWLADGSDIDGATSTNYTLTAADVGKAIKVRVSFTDDAGNEESLTSAATATVAARPNSAATGSPRIDGSPVAGQTLTATTSGVADEDGIGNAVFAHQWIRHDPATAAGADIQGATASSYTATGDDVGKALKLRVTFTDDAGNEESLTSAATAAVAARPNSAATGAPSIDGSPAAGQTLTAATSGVADEDGTDNAVFAYQWIRHDPATAADADIQGATASTYTATGDDVGQALKVRVTFTDDAGNEESLTSAATATVAARPNSAAPGAPRIDGSPVVGQTLTAATSGVADEDGIGNAVFAYQWIRHDPATAAGADIQGATASTYTATGDDVGKALKVRVTFTDDAGNEESLASAATAAVATRPNSAATGAPRIDGSPVAGQTLTATTSGVADEDGIGNAVFAYQWIRHDPATAAGADIQGATASAYTATGDDVGKALKMRVTFTDDAGNEESLTSAATAAVAARPNSAATGAPSIDGSPVAGQTLTASTSGVADEDGIGNAVFAYQWIRHDPATAAGADIQGATASTYTATGDDVGKALKVRVTFTDDAGNEESLTSAATAAITRPPLTASAHDAPDSHNGQGAFTFELRFSEEFGISYRTLRDHAFTVTGGEVVKARRLEPGKNVRWEIHVRPTYNADVTIVMPVTTDCSVQGAVCTGDGRMLSSRLELTFPGPGG